MLIASNDAVSVEQIAKAGFDGIVLAPGPQRPADAGILMEVLAYFYDKLPILGICLGYQAIGEFFGAQLEHAALPVHGKTSLIQHKGMNLFEGLKQPTQVMRYHSLLLTDLPDCLEPLAWTAKNELMGLCHKQYPIVGVQFHPESILSLEGLDLLKNWISHNSNIDLIHL